MDLRNVVALVTGGASGLGLAAVEQLVRRGARAVVALATGARGAGEVEVPALKERGSSAGTRHLVAFGVEADDPRHLTPQG